MNGCSAVRAKFTEYMDDRLNGREMQFIAAHLEDCRACSREWSSLRQVQASLASLGPAPEPADLPLRIRVAISQERARSRQSIFTGWNLVWRNTLGPFLLQASAGFASAVLLMGSVIVLATMFTQPEIAHASKDEPLGNATAPRLLYLSSAVGNNEMGDISGTPSWWRLISTAQAGYTTIASSPDPPTKPPVRRLRTCCCSASLSRPASSASRSAAWRCSPSPAFPCGGDKSRE
jgi:hypothetical protein